MTHYEAAAILRACGAVESGQGWLITVPIGEFVEKVQATTSTMSLESLAKL